MFYMCQPVLHVQLRVGRAVPSKSSMKAALDSTSPLVLAKLQHKLVSSLLPLEYRSCNLQEPINIRKMTCKAVLKYFASYPTEEE